MLIFARRIIAIAVLLQSQSGAIGAKPGPVLPSQAMTIAFVRGDDIWIASGQGTDQRLLIRHAASPAWSPNHKRIAFSRGGEVWVSNRDGSDQRQLTRWNAGVGKRIQGDPPEIRISWDPIEPVLTVSREEQYDVVRGNKRTTVTGSALYDVTLVPGPGRKPVERFGPEEDGAGYQFSDQECPAWSRDGKWVAFARNGDIWITFRKKPEAGDFRKWNRDTWRLTAPAVFDDPDYHASRENEGVKRLSWSPDGRHLAYCMERLQGSGTYLTVILTIGRGSAGSPKVLGRHEVPGYAFQPCFSSDGKWIAFGSWGTNGTGGPDIWATSLDGKISRLLIMRAWNAVW